MCSALLCCGGECVCGEQQHICCAVLLLVLPCTATVSCTAPGDLVICSHTSDNSLNMSESIESFWKEYESLATEFGDSETSSTLAPWIVREQVDIDICMFAINISLLNST